MKRLICLFFILIFACSSCSYAETSLPDASFSLPETPAPSSEPMPESTPEATPEPTHEHTPEPMPTPELSEEEKFAFLAPTVNMSFEELVGDNGIYDDIAAYPEPDTYKLIVDLAHQVVLVYKKDESGEFTVPVRYMICSSGKKGNAVGTFEMGEHRVRFGKFVNDGVYGQYWSNIYGRIYFHTILYSKRSAGTYTSSYKHLGKKASHGCIRLTVPDARWIFYNAAPGSVCEIRAGSKDDLETAAIKEKLILAEYPKKRVKLVKGEIPDTDNWSIDELNKALGLFTPQPS